MKSSSLAHIYALMMMSGAFMPSFADSSELTTLEIFELKKRYERMKTKQLLIKGCKEFHYQYRISESITKEFTIIALNKKNADRKYQTAIKLWKETL
jgi:hypothetical protein